MFDTTKKESDISFDSHAPKQSFL